MNSFTNDITKNFNRYTLFMGFPMLLFFGQNLSLLFFLYLFYIIPNKSLFIKSTHWIQVIVILFGFGAILSALDVNTESADGVDRAMAVLPNYIYWTIMLMFLINMRDWIQFDVIIKYIFKGFIFSLIYYQVSPFIPRIPGFMNAFTPNSYAFLCIAFTAPAATYLLYKKGYLYSIVLVGFVLFTLLMAGRRAGFVLVLLSSMLSIHFKNLSIKQIIIVVFVSIFGFLMLQLELVEDAIYTSNPRVHELIYENEEIATTDRSVLTRKLMVEKALIILSEHPLTGVGLNNFTNYEVDFLGDFEGAIYVQNKKDNNTLSAHNSYASLIAEGGLLLTIPFLIILIFNFIIFVLGYNKRSHIENTFYIALIAMSIHFYYISALLNVYAWFMIGLTTSLSSRRKNLKLNRI